MYYTMRWSPFIIILVIIYLPGCKDPYYIKAKNDQQRILVVEGNLDNSDSGTIIKLSRSIPMDTSWTRVGVDRALVTVEDGNGAKYSLTETKTGFYKAIINDLRFGGKYYVRIKTGSGEEYLSAPVLFQRNPEIDSLSWSRSVDGVTINVNTHDQTNQTHYYRWTYNEVYQFHSGVVSMYMFVGDDMVARRFTADVYECWRYDTSTRIFVGSSIRLANDIIYHFPVRFVPSNTEPLSSKYYIKVQQYALSKEAYDFFVALQKNTESLGTIFDPQPTQLQTNINCLTNKNQKAIGYITGSPVKQKDMFIKHEDLPGWSYIISCNPDTIKNRPDDIRSAFLNGLSPYALTTGGDILMSDKYCVDCTTRGTAMRPDFW